MKDYTGQRKGRLVAVKRTGANKHGQSVWEFQCDCGGSIERKVCEVLNGRGISHCGCVPQKGNLRHGKNGTPEHTAWVRMKSRCTDVQSKDYKNYGGRGIKVSEVWKGSRGFVRFLNEVGMRPTPQHSIDRENNNGDYEPGNVRWATRQEQNRNKRIYKNNTTGVRGVQKKGGVFAVSYNRKYLGCTQDFFGACCARKSAEVNHGN